MARRGRLRLRPGVPRARGGEDLRRDALGGEAPLEPPRGRGPRPPRERRARHLGARPKTPSGIAGALACRLRRYLSALLGRALLVSSLRCSAAPSSRRTRPARCSIGFPAAPLDFAVAGGGAVRQRTCFGSTGPWVRIPPARPAEECGLYRAAWYRSATTPEANSWRLTSFRSIGFDSPAKSVGPCPATRGCTSNSYSSIRPSSASACGS